MDEYIPLEDCQDGFLYEIKARNFSFGVFCAKTKGFIGIRNKFGNEFLDEEFHWDTGAPFGTAKPIRMIKECPEICRPDNDDLFKWLEKQ